MRIDLKDRNLCLYDWLKAYKKLLPTVFFYLVVNNIGIDLLKFFNLSYI